MGAGVLNNEAKSKSCESTGRAEKFFSVGEPASDMMEDTDRRFVRTGVRVGNAGGAFEEDVVAVELERNSWTGGASSVRS